MRRVPLLRGLSWDLLSSMAAFLRPIELAPGGVLYRQGEPAGHFYVIESGRLRGSVGDGGNPRAFGAGQSVGDGVLVRGPNYMATISAQTAARLWALAASDLMELRRTNPALDQALGAIRPGVEVSPVAEAEPGFRIDVRGLSRWVKGGKQILHDVSFFVRPGELVCIVGGSGAGKTTLLDAISGVAPADDGTVLYDGVDYYSNMAAYRSSLGYVPQDDIIHRELPLELTLRYSARLRLPSGTPDQRIEEAVRDAMEALDLSERAGLRVGALSGGQRKRASIGVELLTKPRVFFLDEPTSGLDPATGSELMRGLRRLSDAGSTVVLTTHAIQDIAICDKVVFLAKDGHLAFFGTPGQSVEYFQASAYEEIYERLAEEGTPQVWSERFRRSRWDEAPGDGHAEEGQMANEAKAPALTRPSIGPLRQWTLLTRRNVDILIRNPLTLAILIGSPILVVLMFAVLFKPGAFDLAHPSPSATIMIIYWIAFGGFFFGVTYGLLQICTEFAIVRRERLVNLSIAPYILSKLAVLLPLLFGVSVVMLVVLRLFDRLPSSGLGVYGSLLVTLTVDAAAALALGLLVSASVSDAAQATVALPLVCFPQVLFSGAILAIPIMAPVGRWISYAMSDRWAFEGLGKALNLNDLYAHGGSSLGPPLLALYGNTFGRAVWVDWAIMGAMAVVFLAGAMWVCARKCRVPTR